MGINARSLHHEPNANGVPMSKMNAPLYIGGRISAYGPEGSLFSRATDFFDGALAALVIAASTVLSTTDWLTPLPMAVQIDLSSAMDDQRAVAKMARPLSAQEIVQGFENVEHECNGTDS